ncbi:HipA domain-containing protein [uncultured Desulfosarcina sp.]|uniref:type II toxin-antitoxin system HipA family toxin n=1 Tax=uncultured Desulfosarcina sp. TaxID=218289 RepID=UPI0029C6A4FB|nr:HipA domain-containing protein [uncultured Desulfosarcina sp.]
MSAYAEVKLWGRTIGAVAEMEDGNVAAFEYDGDFVHSGIEVAPLMMPLSRRVYTFPELPARTFYGLPGMLADALPDKFGHALINAWLATQGRAAETFTAVERLCYVGRRGTGALEFAPAIGPRERRSSPIEVDRLVALASEILSRRNHLSVSFDDRNKEKTLADILKVGTSAGGARAKAIIAWNPATNEVRSGQVDAPEGFRHWLLKFDGVAGNRDKELADPQGYGAVEYAYWMMARDAGITMTECRLFEENGRRHFMTRRFDRTDDGEKLYMQSLCGLAHFDFNMAGAYSYEQALLAIRQLGLPMDAVEEQFRRMAFNIIARNQDDHVKNIAFLMDKNGRWSLSPAFDVTYSYNPDGAWTGSHQMTMNGKRDDFILDDFRACARFASMKRGRAEAIVKQVQSTVSRWREYADEARVKPDWRDRIQTALRLNVF